MACHSRKRSATGIIRKKDSGQAGMTPFKDVFMLIN
jgi:hypothetical protein